MRAEDIKELIQQGLNECTAIVEGDDGVHFTAMVISPDFADKSRVQKQQLVYAALGNRIQFAQREQLTLFIGLMLFQRAERTVVDSA